MVAGQFEYAKTLSFTTPLDRTRILKSKCAFSCASMKALFSLVMVNYLIRWW